MPWFQVDDKFWSHPTSGTVHVPAGPSIADRAAAGHVVDGDVVEQEVLDA